MDANSHRIMRFGKFLLCDIIFVVAILANIAQIAYDYEYWEKAPQPFYFLIPHRVKGRL